MAINKVVFDGNTLIDLTGVTVTPEVLLEGFTAYDAAGNLITGTYGAASNLLTMNDGLINKRVNSSGSVVNASGYFVSDYFAVDYSKKKGLKIVDAVPNIESFGTTAYGSCMFIVYDSEKTRIGQWYISRRNAAKESKWTAAGNDLVLSDIAANHGASIGSLATITDWTTVKFSRLVLALNNAAAAISSVNEVLTSGIEILAI